MKRRWKRLGRAAEKAKKAEEPWGPETGAQKKPRRSVGEMLERKAAARRDALRPKEAGRKKNGAKGQK